MRGSWSSGSTKSSRTPQEKIITTKSINLSQLIVISSIAASLSSVKFIQEATYSHEAQTLMIYYLPDVNAVSVSEEESSTWLVFGLNAGGGGKYSHPIISVCPQCLIY